MEATAVGAPVLVPTESKAERSVRRGMKVRNAVFVVLLGRPVSQPLVGGVQYFGQRGTFVGFTESGQLATYRADPGRVVGASRSLYVRTR